MSSLIHSLPAPRATPDSFSSAGSGGSSSRRSDGAGPTTARFVPPALGHRKGFRPRTARDYGDGGAFPEIHVVQYPLDMGRKHGGGGGGGGTGKVVALTTDADGSVRHDAILQKGSHKVVYSRHQDLVPAQSQVKSSELERPDEDAVARNADETAKALQKIVSVKVSAASATQGAMARAAASNNAAPTYVRYTPAASGGQAGGGQTRVVRLVEQAPDPLEPPKFRHKRVAKGPGSPPVPVLHSPPRKVTADDQAAWKIPPCVSNWKNLRGHAIPLHIRLAADGRGLQETQISDKFATLAQSMLHAERMAREEINKRAQIRQALALKEKESQEEALRNMAIEARLMRAGAGGGGGEDAPSVGGGGGGASTAHSAAGVAPAAGAGRADEPDAEREEREQIREERRRERQRANRMDAMGAARKSKLTRDEDRDVSERVALGLQAAPKPTGETQFDQRLFNQSGGVDSGFGDEAGYNVYDKPLFAGQAAANQIYRPRSSRSGGPGGDGDYGTEEDLNKLLDGGKRKFQPSKDFSGVDRSVAAPQRDGPVEFEKVQEADPFGLDEFLQQAKQSEKRPRTGDK